MIFERANGSLFLRISDDFRITFLEEWIKHLRALPYDRFGDFMRGTVYKILSPNERRMWNKTRISNTELLKALDDFT